MNIGRSTWMGMLLRVPRDTSNSLCMWGRHIWQERRNTWNLWWNKLRQNVDSEEPALPLNQVYLGCTQRESKTNKKGSWGEIIMCLNLLSQPAAKPFALLGDPQVTLSYQSFRETCCRNNIFVVLLRHGRTHKDMRWKDTAKQRTKGSSNYTKSPLRVLMDHQI